MLLLFLTSTVSGNTQPIVEFDRWYVAMLQADRVGWMHHRVQRHNDQIESSQEMKMTVLRGDATMQIEITESFVETLTGEPISARFDRTFAGQEVSTQFRFTPNFLLVVTTQGGRSRSEQLPRDDKPWMSPAAAERHMRRQMARGDRTVSCRTFSASSGRKPYEITNTWVGPATVQVHGKVIPADQWNSVLSIAPNLPTTTFVDDDHYLVKTTWRFGPLMEVSLVHSDERIAKADINPPELLAQTLLSSDRQISAPRQRRAATFELHLLEHDVDASEALANLPTVGYQRVTATDADSVRIHVDVEHPVSSADHPTEMHTRASTMIDSDHPRVIELVSRALGDAAATLTDIQKARKLCAFVHDFITERDLSVGFASASEVALTAQGDCSEFGVLLTAMLRAADVPSRTVTGLVYTPHFLGHESVFVYHMWSQAWIGTEKGKWLDFDAALNPRKFDATHITLATNAWNDDDYMNDLLGMVVLFGRLSINVLDNPAR